MLMGQVWFVFSLSRPPTVLTGTGCAAKNQLRINSNRVARRGFHIGRWVPRTQRGELQGFPSLLNTSILVKTTHVLRHSFHGSGVPTQQLSPLCRVTTDCHRGSARGCVCMGVSPERLAESPPCSCRAHDGRVFPSQEEKGVPDHDPEQPSINLKIYRLGTLAAPLKLAHLGGIPVIFTVPGLTQARGGGTKACAPGDGDPGTPLQLHLQEDLLGKVDAPREK